MTICLGWKRKTQQIYMNSKQIMIKFPNNNFLGWNFFLAKKNYIEIHILIYIQATTVVWIQIITDYKQHEQNRI